MGLTLPNVRPFDRLIERRTLFYFLRHGETLGNRCRIFQRDLEPLTETGRAQAKRAACLLEGREIRSIATSDIERCVATARIVGNGLGLVPNVFEGLRERSFGDWVGCSSVDIDWNCLPPKGEPLSEFIQRTRSTLVGILGCRILPLIVAHGGTLAVLAAGLEVPGGEVTSTNGTPIVFERCGRRWRANVLT